MAAIPRPPIEQRFITKLVGVGRDPDRQRIPRFTVDHSMVGTLIGTDSYFRRREVAALTDFGIGQANHNNSGYARIFQWNNYFGTQVGWASGPVRVPMGDGPRILAAFGGASGLNVYGVSIEHDDGGNPATEVTSFQWSASVWLHAWLHGEQLVPNQTADTFDLNAHHREFCGPAYKDCPFPRIYNYTEEFHNAIKSVMRHWHNDVPYPANGVWVAGKKLTVPVNHNSVVKPPEPTSMKVIVPGTNEEFWIIEPFFSYYHNHGGFANFGYPISGMYIENQGEAKGLAVQYFERKRLELQPDGSITEGRLGAELYRQRNP